ncbi:MAG: ADP-ribose pyrophosphatase [Pirellulaceae bacterium]|nr:MAG: ADP-ribose pyrophosphatase [Pirellulaceae bacterium]
MNTTDSDSRQWLYQGMKFKVESLDYTVGPHSITKDIIRHPGAVVVLPWVDESHICLVENYRVAVGKTLLELPAGTCEPPENPLQTARRELEEETGYQAGSWQLLHRFYPSPGILDEQMHLFVARQLTAGVPRREPGEQIQNVILAWSEVLRRLDEGRIQDAKTLVGILLFERWRSRL